MGTIARCRVPYLGYVRMRKQHTKKLRCLRHRQHQVNPKTLCNDPNSAFRHPLPLLLAAERVIGTILIYREGIESGYIGPLIC